MMKKCFYALLIIATLGSSCMSTKSLTKTITYEYANVIFAPTLSTLKLSDGVSLTVTPINAKTLNEETYDAALRNGDYEKEFIDAVYELKSQLSSKKTTISKQERIGIEGIINALECISKLEKNGKISQDVSIVLRRRILNNDTGMDGAEIQYLVGNDLYPSDYNPYRINSNYFSVFKFSFENTTPKVETVKIKDFQLLSNEEQLYPLTMKYFEENLKDETEAIKNLYRLNMPDDLNLTPNQRITKYIAVPAINLRNEKLQVQYIYKNSVVNFDFNVSNVQNNQTYKLERYLLQFDGAGDGLSKNTYYAIEFSDKVTYGLKENIVFLTEQRKEVRAKIYGINIDSGNGKISFTTSGEFAFSELGRNTKILKFAKVKNE